MYKSRDPEVRLCMIGFFFEQFKFIYKELDFELQHLHFLDFIASKYTDTETKQA